MFNAVCFFFCPFLFFKRCGEEMNHALTKNLQIPFLLLIVGVEVEPKHMMDMTLIPSIDPIDIGLGSSEKGNAAPSAKPRKKTMTSVYLKFFETAPDGKSRRCKFCGQSYSIATATGMFHPLASVRP